MPSFASPFHFKPARIKTAPTGTLLLPLQPVGEAHLIATITGGDAIIQLNGHYPFVGEQREGNYDGEVGLAVDAFEIEADLSTAYNPQFGAVNAGDLHICSTSKQAKIAIFAPDGKTMHLAAFIATDTGNADWVGYRNWRFIRYDCAGERVLLFDKP